jgi:hypothetical protein
VAAVGIATGASAEEKTGAEGKSWEEFDASKFSNPSKIDHKWYPLTPGTRLVWDGYTVDEAGEEEGHSIIFVVTDLTKEIGGVDTVVIWDRDFADGELEETEIAFFAQDDDGNVWLMGEYPEEYEDGELALAPAWIHGINGARAGILVPGDPKVGGPMFIQGFEPGVGYTDRAKVDEMGVKTEVDAGSYEDVLVIDEWSLEEPYAHALKYYAPGVGVVRIGSRGSGDQEYMELIRHEKLDAEELTKMRIEALKLDERARFHAKDVYANTSPLKLDGKVVTSSDQMAVLEKVAPEDATAKLGTEEFGLTKRGLVQSVEKVEASIAQCMREQGFQYVAPDYRTVRRGMIADKTLPGMTEKQFINQYGFGLSTLYTGVPPQLAQGYSPAKIGLGRRNVEIYKSLSTADQAAYNRALLGEDHSATFAVSLEQENLSRTGGCTRAAIEKVFTPGQLNASYYNPKDALINKDPRMKAALQEYAKAMRAAGFDYDHPDDTETDIKQRLDAIVGSPPTPVASMSPDQLAALEELRDYERRVAVKTLEYEEKYFEPVEERIEKEMFARTVQ